MNLNCLFFLSSFPDDLLLYKESKVLLILLPGLIAISFRSVWMFFFFNFYVGIIEQFNFCTYFYFVCIILLYTIVK